MSTRQGAILGNQSRGEEAERPAAGADQLTTRLVCGVDGLGREPSLDAGKDD